MPDSIDAAERLSGWPARRRQDGPTDWQGLLRMLATIFGIVIMAIGLIYAVRLFNAIHGALTNPQEIEELVTTWQQIIAANGLTIPTGNGDLEISRVTAIAVLGGGAVALVYIAIALMGIGARIVSWTSSDTEAVKRIMNQALGRPSGSRFQLPQNRDTERST